MGTRTATRDKRRINTLLDINLIIKQDKLMSELGLNYAGYRDLLAIYHNYVSTESGLKVYGLLQMFGFAYTNYRVIFERLNVLKSKGLIYNLNSYYYPTDKTISILNSVTV